MKMRLDRTWRDMIILGALIALLFWGWGRVSPIVEYAVFAGIFVIAGKIVLQSWREFLGGGRGEKDRSGS